MFAKGLICNALPAKIMVFFPTEGGPGPKIGFLGQLIGRLVLGPYGQMRQGSCNDMGCPSMSGDFLKGSQEGKTQAMPM